MRLPLVDGQGNFGSVDGDNAAIGPHYLEEIETMKRGEELRIDRAGGVRGGPPKGEHRFDVTSRGRRSVGLDLKKPEDVETALKLMDKAAALIEGFRAKGRCDFTAEYAKAVHEALEADPSLSIGVIAFYRRQVDDLVGLDGFEVVDAGPLVASVRITRSFRASTVVQVVELRAGSERLGRLDLLHPAGRVLARARLRSLAQARGEHGAAVDHPRATGAAGHQRDDSDHGGQETKGITPAHGNTRFIATHSAMHACRKPEPPVNRGVGRSH